MATTITKWGNSLGVRIPRKVLVQTRLKEGSAVTIEVNDRGCIELVPEDTPAHRSLAAPQKLDPVRFYGEHPASAPVQDSDAWPDDDMVGAEWESWSE